MVHHVALDRWNGEQRSFHNLKLCLLILMYSSSNITWSDDFLLSGSLSFYECLHCQNEMRFFSILQEAADPISCLSWIHFLSTVIRTSTFTTHHEGTQLPETASFQNLSIHGIQSFPKETQLFFVDFSWGPGLGSCNLGSWFTGIHSSPLPGVCWAVFNVEPPPSGGTQKILTSELRFFWPALYLWWAHGSHYY